MQRACDVCGNAYEAKRANSQYCSATCRKRAQRDPGRVMPGLDAPALVEGALFAATFAELDAVGQAESAAGQSALILARRLDSVNFDTGSSIAALAREHRAALQVAVDAGLKTGDAVDDLKAARAKRRA